MRSTRILGRVVLHDYSRSALRDARRWQQNRKVQYLLYRIIQTVMSLVADKWLPT